MTKLGIIAVGLTAAAVFAAKGVRYDSAGDGTVQEYIRRGLAENLVQSNILVNPVLPTNFPGSRLEFWRVVGTNLVEKTQQEKDAILAAETAAAAEAAVQAAKDAFEDRLIRAISRVNMRFFNELNYNFRNLRTNSLTEWRNTSTNQPQLTESIYRNLVRDELDNE